MNLPVLYRSPNVLDLQIIINSWLKSQRNADFTNYITNDFYYSNYELIIKDLINRSMVSIICHQEDHSQVLGYIVYELIPNEPIDTIIVHYLYVKAPFRNYGLAKGLLNTIYPFKSPIFLTHIDKTNHLIRLDKYSNLPYVSRTSAFIKTRDRYNLIYNPFLMIQPQQKETNEIKE